MTSKVKTTGLEKFLNEIETRLNERYSFDILKENSFNFGVLVNYRQEWKPLNFQVGDLVNTLPLAPGESRKYTKKKIVKTHRSEREIQDFLQVRKLESTETSRVEAEIVSRASNKTNFHHSASGGFDVGIGNDNLNFELSFVTLDVQLIACSIANLRKLK